MLACQFFVVFFTMEVLLYNTIVVPIHLPEADKAATMLEAARQIGGDAARIILTSVVEDVPTFIATELPGGVMEKSREEAKRQLEAIAKASGVDADVEVRIGRPATAIIAVASEHRADIIVMAAHRPGLQQFLIGSTAARVVRHAPCSVLVLR